MATGVARYPPKLLDLHIREPMQICIHRTDNLPKPVNHRLTLRDGPEVKSYNIRRFPAKDFLQVGFTLQTSRTNNKGDIGTLKVCYMGYFGTPWMTLN